jgi:CrcB protein
MATRDRIHHQLAHTVLQRWDVLLVIGLGGALGSLARYGVGQALPHDPGEVAWSTMVENVTGGFALGLLMVFVTEAWPSTRYLRPFLAVGVLGGYTTFSTYMLDTRALLAADRYAAAAGYLFGTLVIGLLAVWVGIVMGRLAVVRGRMRTR